MEEVDLMAKIEIGTIPEVNFDKYDTYLDYPHLYNSLNDDFSTPGLTLSDAINVQVTCSYNQYPMLTMTYPRDGIHMIDIQENKYLMEDCDYRFTHQLFKIIHITPDLDQVIVEAKHIAATLNDSTVPSAIQMQNGTAQDVMNQVLNVMQPQRDFTFHSNVTKVASVNIEKNQQAGDILINPDQEGDNPTDSVLGYFGGELQFDNFDIYHDEHLGQNKNIVISYGKNLQSFQHDINTENMWTGAVFTATYTPGQAIAKEDWSGWASWQSDYSSVGTYSANGSIDVYDSPVEGHHSIGQITTGTQLKLGEVVHNGDMTPDGKYQINTVNSDDWYPIEGGGWVDARWISFDTSGSYIVNSVTGDVTVQANSPYDESGAGTRVSMSGTAVVAYKPGGSIHVYASPEIGPDHVRIPNWTVKNGTVIHYDMVERNQNGDLWYRIGPGQWLYGPHLSLTQEGAYKSYTNSGYGYLKDNQVLYHWDKNNYKMTATTKTVDLAKSKNKESKNYWKTKQKKVKVTAHKGRAIIDRTVVQDGKTYMHTQYGWVSSEAIDYHKNGSVPPKSYDQIINQKVQDNSKVEIYATPDSRNALNWSIPNGASSANGDFTVNGHEAKGGDGKTYIEVTYHGKTGWLMEDNINSDKSTLNSADDSNDENSDTNSGPTNVDLSQKEVTVTVGPLYADGFGNNPNIDKVNSVDLSSNFIHDDQDLSGQQPDGSFAPTQADIQQLTKLGQDYIIEHRYGHPEVQDTLSWQEMSGINADWTQVGLYDYVIAQFDKYHLSEREQINTTVWDGLAHHFVNVSIGKLPITWQHLLLQQAKEQTSTAIQGQAGRTQGWLNRFEDMMHSEESDRRAKENAMMEDLGMLQHDVTWEDDKGKEHKLKDVFLETRKDFEDHFQQLDDDASDIKSWIDAPGEGVIQALPNWQAPQQLTARSSNGGKMVFGGNGLEFYDERSQKLLTGMDSRGKLYADSIEGVKVNAMEIDALLMHGDLKSEDPNSSMKIYIGTQNPGSTLNPWKSGRVIWTVSDNYSSMVSSGQIATTSGDSTTRIHPSAITVDNDDNQVLTQENFAAHAYRRIKSWVKLWIADWITINGEKHTIWKGIDNGAYMGKLRDLPGQGRNDYRYIPGNNDDYGSDEGAEGDGTDLGQFATPSDIQISQQEMQSLQSSIEYLDNRISGLTPPDLSTGDSTVIGSSDESKMLTYTEASNLGLPTGVDLGTKDVGTDGNTYIYLIYTPTGNAHWFRT